MPAGFSGENWYTLPEVNAEPRQALRLLVLPAYVCGV